MANEDCQPRAADAAGTVLWAGIARGPPRVLDAIVGEHGGNQVGSLDRKRGEPRRQEEPQHSSHNTTRQRSRLRPRSGSVSSVRQLESGWPVREVVRDIAKSGEHLQRFWCQESGEGMPYLRAVGTMYRHILGRQADDAGARSWAQSGSRNGAEAVIDALIDSVEYNQQFGDWGVPGSGGLRYCGPDNQGPLAHRFRLHCPSLRGNGPRRRWRHQPQGMGGHTAGLRHPGLEQRRAPL